jgi:hypothetical protein
VKPYPTDAMARLAAADPARRVPVDEAERARLWRLIAATPDGRSTPAATHARLRPAFVIPALLVLAVGALAASGAIGIGAPAESGNSMAGHLAALRDGSALYDAPIAELRYRDGVTCHLTALSWIDGKDACTPELESVGWVAPTSTPTAARVAVPLRTRVAHTRRDAAP